MCKDLRLLFECGNVLHWWSSLACDPAFHRFALLLFAVTFPGLPHPLCGLTPSAMWNDKQIKQQKVPGDLFRNDVGTGGVFRNSCCGSVVNFYWVLAVVCFWVHDLARINFIFSFFSAAEGTCEHDNARCSVNNVLLFCSDVSEANASLWYNFKYFLQEFENIWLPHYFKPLLLWNPLVLLVICL